MPNPGIIGQILPITLGLGSPLQVGGTIDTAAEMRADDNQHFVHVLFIEGIQYAWTDDRSGDLWGSGINSWIGEYENGQSWETVGQREVLPGLIVPDVTQARNPKTGQPVEDIATFRIQDNAAYDTSNIVAGLFADSGKPSEVLGVTISAGTSNLSNSVAAWGSGSTLNPRGRWIGVEKIGTGGQRAQCYPMPLQAIGYEHAVQPNILPPEGLPLVGVSDNPIVWEGRKVTLYRIYKNPDATLSGFAAWPTWDLQDAAGNIVWWGVLQGEAKVTGGQEWHLSCHGWHSWLQRKLNQNTTPKWHGIRASLQLESDETACAVVLVARQPTGGAGNGLSTYFQSSVFDPSNTISSTSKAELIADLDQIIEDTIDGTDTNVNLSSGTASAWTLDATGQNFDAGIDPSAWIFVEKDDFTSAGGDSGHAACMYLVLHEKVWETLGYEPSTQDHDLPHDADNFKQIAFQKLDVGAVYDRWNSGTEVVPGEGYWEGEFTTLPQGWDFSTVTENYSDEWANGGLRRNYLPAFGQNGGETFILDHKPGQEIELGQDYVYAEPQNTLLPMPPGIPEVNSSATDSAKLAVFRGKRLPVSEDATEKDLEKALDNGGEDFYAAAIVSWVNGSQGVGAGANSAATVHVDQWLDARIFGFETRAHDRGWVGATTGPAKIEMAFMAGWPYMAALAGNAPEHANAVFTTLMLSSGTGTGFTGLTLDEGVNSPNASPNFLEGGDWEVADLGLGIPYQMVQDPTDIREVFDSIPGGSDGALNRVRHAYVGPLNAQDVIDGLLRPRRIGWTLNGAQYGLQRLGPKVNDDVQLTIAEDDLAGRPGDPTTVIPTVEPGRLGSFDDLVLDYRWSPSEGSTVQELRVPARDSGARLRSGAQELRMSAPGLLPYRWYTDMKKVTGVQPWADLLRELWSDETAEYFADRHHMVTLKVGPHIAMDCRVGTVVRLSNNWPAAPDGTYGLTNAVGTIERVTYHPGDGTATLEIMIFGGRFYDPPHFSPIAHITSWSGAVLTVDSDYFGHGNANRHDAAAFVEPSWSSVGGSMDVEIWERSGTLWTVTDAATVSSVNTSSDTITLSSSVPSTVLRDTDKFLVARSYSNQAVGNWVRAIMGFWCEDSFTHSSGVAGRQYL